MNPEWELGRFLTDDTDFEHVVQTYGALELRSPGTLPRTLAVLQENVVHERDAWEYLRATFGSYLEDLYRVIEEDRTADSARVPDPGGLRRCSAARTVRTSCSPPSSPC